MSIHQRRECFDVVVAGGGLSGVCAAIAAARHGAKTAIVQNRPMFGGNASSEIRMHILGANCHQVKDDMRETGIVEEILLANKKRNPYASFPIFDTVLWEKVRFQKNLTSYLNTNMDDVVMDNGRIRAIICHQSTTETELVLEGKVFIDATGHGTLGVMAGGAYRVGSESRHEFGEPTAPEEPNNYTMGNTLMFVAKDRGEPILFERPEGANRYTEEDLQYRPHENGIHAHADGGEIIENGSGNQLPGFSGIDSGYWWIELGGDNDDIIAEAEEIRDELYKAVFGVWDHLKNVGDHGTQNLDLEWVGMVPGYRESRRLEGDYVLNENDVRANRIFDDAVAYGGWPMDNHVPGGLRDMHLYPSEIYNFDGCYTIPYGCFVSKNVDNLMMAGRDISTSKMAFSSVRVMGTCAIGGQAVGTAAALAAEKNCTPREVGQKHIRTLQQQLLRDDCYIPGLRNEDENDLARRACAAADSQIEGGEASNVINGVSRTVGDESNCWISAPLAEKPAVLTLKLPHAETISELRLTFDSNLSREIMPSIQRIVRERQVKGLPEELVRDYAIELRRDGQAVWSKTVTGNGQRLNIHALEGVNCDEVRITVTATHGCPNARIYEVRLY